MKTVISLLVLRLAADERDAVLGDLAELGQGDLGCVLELLGLVVRREAALWQSWQPWFALVVLVAMAGWLLTRTSFYLSFSLVKEALTYRAVGVFYQNGTNTVAQELTTPLCASLILIVCSWGNGFALALLSKRTTWLIGALYFAIWTVPLPLLLSIGWQTMHGTLPLPPHYIFELILQTGIHILLFGIPSFIGMRQARRHAAPKT